MEEKYVLELNCYGQIDKIPAGWKESFLSEKQLVESGIPFYKAVYGLREYTWTCYPKLICVIHEDFKDAEEKFEEEIQKRVKNYEKKDLFYRSHKYILTDEEVKKNWHFTDLTKRELAEYNIPYEMWVKKVYILGKNKFEGKKYGRIIPNFYKKKEKTAFKKIEIKKIERFVKSLVKFTDTTYERAYEIAKEKIKHKKRRLEELEGTLGFAEYKKLEPLRIIEDEYHANRVILRHNYIESKQKIEELKRCGRWYYGYY